MGPVLVHNGGHWILSDYVIHECLLCQRHRSLFVVQAKPVPSLDPTAHCSHSLPLSSPIFSKIPTQAMLDSSPIVLPPARPLKRSASTASLPTPPRTLDKKKSLARSAHDSDTESNYSQNESDEEEEEDRIVLGRKKRRTNKGLKGLQEDDDENAFWAARSKSTRKRESTSTADPTEERNDSPTSLLERRMQMQVSPISPPPSKRRQANTEPPITPESASSSSRMLTRSGARSARRDSPQNPFLDDSPLSVAGSPTPRTPISLEEKPYVTYVL